MEKVHVDNAARQRAYRERNALKRRSGTDAALNEAARSLHRALRDAARAGDNDALLLLGETAQETLANLERRFTPTACIPLL